MRADVSERHPVRVLAHLGPDAAPLLGGLGRRPWLEIESTEGLEHLDGHFDADQVSRRFPEAIRTRLVDAGWPSGEAAGLMVEPGP